MLTVWNFVNHLKIGKNAKNGLFLVLLIMAAAVLGGIVWFVIGKIFFPGLDCLLCFMGYPAVFAGFFGGILYLYNHEF